MVVAIAEAELARKRLGERIDFMNIVVDEMEEVAHLFIGVVSTRDAPTDRVVDAGELLRCCADRPDDRISAWASPGTFWATSFSSCRLGE